MKHILGLIFIIFPFLANANNGINPKAILAGAWIGLDQNEQFNWEICVVLSENGNLKMTAEIFDNRNEKKPIVSVYEGIWRVDKNYYILEKKMTSYQGIKANDDVRTEKYRIEYLNKDLFVYRHVKSQEKFVFKRVSDCET